METCTQEKPFREGRKRTGEVDQLVRDARENVQALSNLHRQRRSLERYIGYMAIAGECVKIEPCSFEEAMQ